LLGNPLQNQNLMMFKHNYPNLLMVVNLRTVYKGHLQIIPVFITPMLHTLPLAAYIYI